MRITYIIVVVAFVIIILEQKEQQSTLINLSRQICGQQHVVTNGSRCSRVQRNAGRLDRAADRGARRVPLSYCTRARAISLFGGTVRYNSLSLERARGKFATDIYGLLFKD